MAGTMDISIRRNEDWIRAIFLTTENGPVDLSGCTAALLVREQLTDSVVATAEVTIEDATGGELQIVLNGTGTLVDWGDPLRSYEFPYDLQITDPDGKRTDVLAGKVIVDRGIS